MGGELLNILKENQNGLYRCPDNYTHSTNHDEGYIETLYHFPEETIIRTDDKLPSLVNNNNLKTYLNYIYKDKLQTFTLLYE